MADPVLTATLSGKKAILLSWTFTSNADFQVFWKSSIPAGQGYALLATTNAFSFTTADLESSKTYDFYVRANVGVDFYYSNIVELFVSCGKGVVLEAPPPPIPPQIPPEYVYAYHTLGVSGPAITKVGIGVPVRPEVEVLQRVTLASIGINNVIMSMAQHPTNKTTFYFIEQVTPNSSYKLWEFIWPSTLTLVLDMTGIYGTGGFHVDRLAAIAVNPATEKLHYCVASNRDLGGGYQNGRIVDINITDKSISYTAEFSAQTFSLGRMMSFVSGGQLYFASAGDTGSWNEAVVFARRKTAGSTSLLTGYVDISSRGQGMVFEDSLVGEYIVASGELKSVNFAGASITVSTRSSNNPGIATLLTGIPIRTFADGNYRYYFVYSSPQTQHIRRFNISNGVTESADVCTVEFNNTVGANGAFAWKIRSNYYRIAYMAGEDTSMVRARNMYVGETWTLGGVMSAKVDEDDLSGVPTAAYIHDLFME